MYGRLIQFPDIIINPLSNKVVLNSANVINLYPQLSVDVLHKLEELKLLEGTELDSIIHVFNNIIVKYAFIDPFAIRSAEVMDINLFYNEIIIGLELNKLNSPNFVKTIGYFKTDTCQIPYLNEDQRQKPCVYLYVEKVPGVTLAKFIKTASLVQFKDIILKLLIGYKQALDTFQFTHYDLHHSNVIITYKDEELVPVFIDFGASHMSFQEGNIGKTGITCPTWGNKVSLGETFIEEGRYPDRSNWIYDFFKLICYIWADTTSSFIIKRTNKMIKRVTDDIIFDLSGRYDLESEMEDFQESGGSIDVLLENIKSEIPEKDYINSKTLMKNARDDLLSTKKFIALNRANLKAISDYCVKLLKFFRDDVNHDWLKQYYKFSPYFSSWLTSEGERITIDEFIDYTRTVE